MTDSPSTSIRQYGLVTLSYWAFTLTDGALRMLVLLYFHRLGFSPIEIASLFILYEISGVFTSLLGGWLASRVGLAPTLQLGLVLQILAITMLLVDNQYLTVAYVMIAQAMSGIGKDLNKLSAKSSIKILRPENAKDSLFNWVALLTGSKNTLKGIGFFLGGALLSLIGFQNTLILMALFLVVILLLGIFLLPRLKYAENKSKFKELFSKSAAINRLSFARLFLFGSRDIWFVVALPVFLQSELGWSYWQVGSLMSLWIIGYGGIQTLAPNITGKFKSARIGGFQDQTTLVHWGSLLFVIPLVMAVAMMLFDNIGLIITICLIPYGFLFAINSSVHSYLILAYASRDQVSLDVGFYYMANAGGRLLGTILSGIIFQYFGLVSCLLTASSMIFISTFAAKSLPGPTED